MAFINRLGGSVPLYASRKTDCFSSSRTLLTLRRNDFQSISSSFGNSVLSESKWHWGISGFEIGNTYTAIAIISTQTAAPTLQTNERLFESFICCWVVWWLVFFCDVVFDGVIGCWVVCWLSSGVTDLFRLFPECLKVFTGVSNLLWLFRFCTLASVGVVDLSRFIDRLGEFVAVRLLKLSRADPAETLKAS